MTKGTSVFDQVVSVLEDLKPSQNVQLEADLRQDLGLDSLDLISFFFEVEKMFDLKISQADIESENLMKIENVVRYVEKKKQIAD